ncbi:NADH-dependent flavin oxidoreductase [Lacticaseibacillus songhuajiangensis]|jgi:2,4-dienoyl-CoA reductase-like NADH-dependent reductase (Old Yellow Enzyme family)|uniref:NADH-dependent flavin oxidoreductase n=1 Tax=Lacticaseibacillus songhuajiangensis TaxID=1296539 RepID=UPI000F7B3490|nr:NADH-dependent flavin oxidoreductase [Lacticaseibacillus songhuajiangensis]
MPAFNDKLELRSGVTLKNRLFMSPMTTQQSFYNGTVTQDEIKYYADRAKGLGAVITGAANVQDGGKGWPGELSIAHDEMLPELSQLAKAIQGQGAKAIVQIFHGGRMTHRATLSGEQPVSASAVAALRPDAETPRAMTVDEIHATIAAFGVATRRAIQAGFDGVELHGANTYLIQQFFSPHSNRRTDEYGGSREKRYRFIKELLDSVFAAVDQYADRPFIVGYRFSPLEFEEPGIRFDDTLWLLDQLKTSRLDYLHMSLNRYDRSEKGAADTRSMLARAHERLDGSMPLIGVGGVRTRADVEGVLQSADAVAIGQQLLYDPTWAVKLADGLDDAMLSADFEDALKFVPLNKPLHDFASSMVLGRKARQAAYRKEHPAK